MKLTNFLATNSQNRLSHFSEIEDLKATLIKYSHNLPSIDIALAYLKLENDINLKGINIYLYDDNIIRLTFIWEDYAFLITVRLFFQQNILTHMELVNINSDITCEVNRSFHFTKTIDAGNIKFPIRSIIRDDFYTNDNYYELYQRFMHKSSQIENYINIVFDSLESKEFFTLLFKYFGIRNLSYNLLAHKVINLIYTCFAKYDNVNLEDAILYAAYITSQNHPSTELRKKLYSCKYTFNSKDDKYCMDIQSNEYKEIKHLLIYRATQIFIMYNFEKIIRARAAKINNNVNMLLGVSKSPIKISLKRDVNF